MSEHETETRALTSYRAISLSRRPYLLVMAGSDFGQRYSLEPGEVVLGRSADADIVLDDSKISRRHVRITVEESAATLLDLGSTNGTYVNNRAVEHSELLDGDLISLGRTILKYTCQAEIDAQLHEELTAAARLDGLTGLLNRRFFFKQLEVECERATRGGKQLGLLIGDLDHFKEINDTHGHRVGDLVLQLVADTIRRHIDPERDIAGRYGGDEIVVLLTDTDSERARRTAEAIRQAVIELESQFEGGLKVSLSIGIAMLDGLECDREQLLCRADENLYRAKAAGRDRVAT